MVQKRRSGYYFRWVFPDCIQQILLQKELVRSLKTDIKHVAYQRSSVYFDLICTMKSLKKAVELAEISKELFEEMIREIWDKARNTPIYPVTTSHHAEARRKKAKERLELISHTYRGTHPGGGMRPALFDEYRQNAALRMGVDIDDDGVPNGSLEELNRLDHLAVVLLEAEKLYFKRVEEAFRPYRQESSDVIEAEERSQEKSGVLMSGVFKAFLDHKKRFDGLTSKLESDYTNYMTNFFYFQEDQDIAYYTRKNFLNFYNNATSLPKRNIKPYKNKSLEEIFSDINPEDIPIDHVISPKLIAEHRKLFQGIYKYARDQEIITTTLDLSMPFKTSGDTRYSDFRDAEVVSLFSMLDEGTDRYWITNIAAYTGMRSGEICQLTSSDFRFDEESGIHYILVNDSDGRSLKTEAGLRQVPVHKNLINIGLLGFAKDKNGALFPSTDSKSITRWFSSFKSKVGIAPVNDFGNRKVFHSFRHTFISKAAQNGKSQQLIAAVVGHESKRTITDNYTHIAEVGSLREVVESISFGYG